MPSKQVILNADGTYTPPWGGKFWTKKITGRVTSCNVNNTSHYSSSYETLETTTYYGGSGYLGSVTVPRLHTVSGTMKSSSFSIEDAQGNHHSFYIEDHLGIALKKGDMVTIIKSDSVLHEETTDNDSHKKKAMQLRYILNNTNGQTWVNTSGLVRFVNVVVALLLPFVLVAWLFGGIVIVLGMLLNSISPHSWGMLNYGLLIIFAPTAFVFLFALYFDYIGKKRAGVLLPYMAIFALSKDGKISESDLSAAYNSGKYFISKRRNKPKNKWVAAALAFFLGAFGVHKFYLGYYKQGLIMLLMFVSSFVLANTAYRNRIVVSLLLFIPVLTAVIESILYITKPVNNFAKTYVIGKRPWF